MQILRIRELESDPYSKDEENEYISLDEPIRIEILAACSDEPKPTTRHSKELV